MICDTFYDRPDEVHSKLDCDGDHLMDHACVNLVNHKQWLVLTSETCGDQDNIGTWGPSQRKDEECPQAFGMIF